MMAVMIDEKIRTKSEPGDDRDSHKVLLKWQNAHAAREQGSRLSGARPARLRSRRKERIKTSNEWREEGPQHTNPVAFGRRTVVRWAVATPGSKRYTPVPPLNSRQCSGRPMPVRTLLSFHLLTGAFSSSFNVRPARFLKVAILL